jgi:nitroreductase
VGPDRGQHHAGPLRLRHLEGSQGKLAPALSEGNHAKTMAAPVTVIIGFDLDFHEKLPYLFPHTDAKAWFDGPQEGRHEAAIRNGSLQGAYLILAARALGLDAGLMSGFDAAKVDEAFFAGTSIKSNFLVNLGYGDRRARSASAAPVVRRSGAHRVSRCIGFGPAVAWRLLLHRVPTLRSGEFLR